MTTEMPQRRVCGTMTVHEELARTSAAYRTSRIMIESFTDGFARVGDLGRLPTGLLRIPVVVHVVFNTSDQNISDSQIHSQIESLNRDFRLQNDDAGNVPAPFRRVAADSQIEFGLALRDHFGKPSSGITRTPTSRTEFDDVANDIKSRASGGQDPWPTDRYLNVWVAPKIMDPLLGSLLGYAQFPGGPAETDGVAIIHSAFGSTGTATPPFHKGRTASHEVGHWLNLLHIWGDDEGACDRSDQVADTPNQAGASDGCPQFPHISCNNGPHGDMFMNYMDYSEDECMCMFSAGQVARMRATLLGPRSSLLTSDALESADRTVAPAGLNNPRGVARSQPAQKLFDGITWRSVGELGPQLVGVLNRSAVR